MAKSRLPSSFNKNVIAAAYDDLNVIDERTLDAALRCDARMKVADGWRKIEQNIDLVRTTLREAREEDAAKLVGRLSGADIPVYVHISTLFKWEMRAMAAAEMLGHSRLPVTPGREECETLYVALYKKMNDGMSANTPLFSRACDQFGGDDLVAMATLHEHEMCAVRASLLATAEDRLNANENPWRTAHMPK